MKTSILLSTFAALSLLAVGCSKTEPAATTGTTGAAAMGEKIGVPECDEYLTKYEACIGKMAPAAKTAAEPALKAQRDSFKMMAANAATKGSLAQTCKQSMESIKASCP